MQPTGLTALTSYLNIGSEFHFPVALVQVSLALWLAVSADCILPFTFLFDIPPTRSLEADSAIFSLHNVHNFLFLKINLPNIYLPCLKWGTDVGVKSSSSGMPVM